MEKQPLVFDKEAQIVLKALNMLFNRTNKSSSIQDHWIFSVDCISWKGKTSPEWADSR